eukprot:GHVT01099050.1.p2 GENE.GHVT01099050.1~~GHVT01099050.1.p2  ORF type:complete len:121 (-),score=34.23 GHVT01099050.1:1606-1968(-)
MRASSSLSESDDPVDIFLLTVAILSLRVSALRMVLSSRSSRAAASAVSPFGGGAATASRERSRPEVTADWPLPGEANEGRRSIKEERADANLDAKSDEKRRGGSSPPGASPDEEDDQDAY